MTLKQLTQITTVTTQLNLAPLQKKTPAWHMEFRHPILKIFPENLAQNTALFTFYFCRLAPQEAFLPFLTFLRCFKPHQDLLWQIFEKQKKTYTKTASPEIPQKYTLKKKKLSIKIIQSIHWIWCSKPQKEPFFCPFCFRCIDPAGQLPFAKASSRFCWSILDDQSLHWILVKVHVLSQALTLGFENND